MRFACRGFLLVAAVAALVAAPTASPSQLLDDNATGVKLAVNGKGEALVTYTANGKQKRVLAWGAVNANPPARGQKQVEFQLDYSGGYGKYRTTYWKTFGSTCLPYDGPPLAWRVTACKAPDGSYWALQSWQRKLKNYGVPSTGRAARLGAAPLALDRRAARAHAHDRTRRPRHDHLFGSYTLTAAASTASARRRRASRSTASAATSTSTPSTRRTARAGSARTASSRTRPAGRSVTSSRATARADRQRHAVPRDRDRPGRHARRDVDGRGAASGNRGGEGEDGGRDPGAERPDLPAVAAASSALSGAR